MKKLIAATLALLLATTLAVGAPAWADSAPIDVNKATAAELTSVKGIGPAKAQAIVDYREAHGAFASIDDLRMVRGIGDKVLESLRPHLAVGAAAETEEASKQ